MKIVFSLMMISVWFFNPMICGADPIEGKIADVQLKIEIPQKIKTFLVMKLGLSSTGKIQAIGTYRLADDSRLGRKRDDIIHVVQKDLNGTRLFWSCLVNLTQGKVQVLYRCQNPDDFGPVLTYNGENPK